MSQPVISTVERKEIMRKIKVLSVFGTRPEAIKVCPLVKVLNNDSRFQSIVCVTSQHKDMLDQVLMVFNITPEYNLNIMREKQSLSMITNSVLLGMEDVLVECKPDYVLVQGDTTTSFTAALASFYKKISVGHIEAGLRTYNKYSPYPEEINRQLTSRIASLHFAPTKTNADYLHSEGINTNVFITGNTVIDALSTTVKENYLFKNEELKSIDYQKKLILLTAHRRENWGIPLENICNAVIVLCNKYPELQFIYPVHLNPIVRNTVYDILGSRPQVILTEPLDVEDMHNLMSKCMMIMTDSGGIQEEAPHLGKPVIVLRAETERPEAVEANTAIVAGTEKDNIIRLFEHIYTNNSVYEKMSKAHNPYGDGKASQRIADAIFTVASVDWQ
jgi:UDP-N-acetylglucosamine 2-epimerase